MKTDRWYCRGIACSVQFAALVSLFMFGACTRESDSPSRPQQQASDAPAPTHWEYSDIDSVYVPGAFILGPTNSSGVVSPACEYVVKVLHNDGGTYVPMGGISVALFWYGDSWNYRRYCEPIVPVPGMSFSHGYGTDYWLTSTTGDDGAARFRLAGAYRGIVNCQNGYPDAPTGQYPNAWQGRVFVMNTQVAGPEIANKRGFLMACADLNGSGGVNGADQSLYLNDSYCTGQYAMRSDYNGDGIINAADLSKFLSVLFSGYTSTSCPAPGV